jgi:Helix-turn-helix domain
MALRDSWALPHAFQTQQAPERDCQIGRLDRTLAGVDIGPYSKIPSKFFGSGMAATLRTSASLLYLALCEHANRNSSNVFKASDKALAADTGLGTRTICNARKRLIEYCLISCSRETGQSHKYTMARLRFEWKPVKERPRSKLRPRALRAVRIPSV